MHNNGDKQTYGALVTAVYRIQKSLARFTMQLGLSAGEFNELVRRAHVEAAEELARAEGGKVLIGEVSNVNDDRTDNVFREEIGRFSTIEEDTDPLHLLVSDYETWLA